MADGPSEKDILLTRVQQGELTPDEAEAEAEQLGVGPLRRDPDPNDFDPMQEVHWTLAMAVAWIAYRTPSAVREWWDSYRTQCWKWEPRDWRAGVDGPVYSGHFLELKETANLDELLLDYLINDAAGHEVEPRMTVAESIKSLHDALSIGMLEASGIEATTKQRVTIGMDLWQDLEFARHRGRDIVRAKAGAGRAMRFDRVTVPSAAVVWQWVEWSWFGPRELPPLMRPEGAGFMPLFCAAQWIATDGGTKVIDPKDVRNWEWSYRALLDHVASGLVKISGVRDGLREPIDGTIFADCLIDYPYQNTTIEMVMSEEYVLVSHDYVDEEHRRKGFDDRIANRWGKLWTRLMVDKADIARNWPFDLHRQNAQDPVPRSKPGRKSVYDWDAARKYVLDQFDHHGALSRDDPEWSCQADVERTIKSFFQKHIGREPASSRVREKAREFIAAFEAGNGR